MNSLYLIVVGLIVVASASAFYFSGKSSIVTKSSKKSSESTSANAEIAQNINNAIKDNNVMIFSKSYCPYCDKAKKALTDLNINFISWELDIRVDGQLVQQELVNKTGQRTVPNIFVKGKHIGGCDATLAAIASGDLQALLKD